MISTSNAPITQTGQWQPGFIVPISTFSISWRFPFWRFNGPKKQINPCWTEVKGRAKTHAFGAVQVTSVRLNHFHNVYIPHWHIYFYTLHIRFYCLCIFSAFLLPSVYIVFTELLDQYYQSATYVVEQSTICNNSWSSSSGTRSFLSVVYVA